MEDEEEQEEEGKGGMQKSRGFQLAAGKKCFSMLLLGNTGASFQDVLGKLAKVDFRHMDAAKGKPYTAKGSRKKWRKGRQNRTQIIGGLATARMHFIYWFISFKIGSCEHSLAMKSDVECGNEFWRVNTLTTGLAGYQSSQGLWIQ